MYPYDIDEIRIGDAERSRALRALARHARAGRLDQAEHAERADAIGSARTRGDLTAVFGDLEPTRGRGPGARGPAGGFARRRFFGVPLFLPLLILTILAITGHIGWLPVLIVAAVAVALAPWRRRWGWGYRGPGRAGWAC